VGLYTSPHLRFVRERIKVNNQPISEEQFAECFWELWDRFERNPAQPIPGHPDPRHIEGKPVYFHYLTLMALHWYMKEKIGTAIIECGIGGEYDTTNVLHRPMTTAVTSLGIDHEPLLGDTIESIAWHKAGIFKPRVPAFSVPQAEGALQVMHDRAKERGTTLTVIDEHQALKDIKLGLAGSFQRLNASLAIAVSASHLSRLGYSGLPDPFSSTSSLPDEFIKGLESARLGGRCDRRPDTALPGLTWYIDGAHTPESIYNAARWFASEADHVQHHSDKTRQPRRMLLFNQQTRDAPALAKRLHAVLSQALRTENPFEYVVFCPNTTYSNGGAAAYKPDLVSINTNKDDVDSLRVQKQLAETYDKIDPDAKAVVCGTIEEAVGRVRESARSQPGDHVVDAKASGDVQVLVTGSLHLVGGLIEVLEAEVEGSR
jgi:folylpolyglutamate synthase